MRLRFPAIAITHFARDVDVTNIKANSSGVVNNYSTNLLLILGQID